jgi:hypothetical protein
MGGVVDGWASSDAACQAGGLGWILVPTRPTFSVEKWLFSVTLMPEGTFSSTAIEIVKWVKQFAVAQAKVSHILRPGKASEKTPKGVILPSL